MHRRSILNRGIMSTAALAACILAGPAGAQTDGPLGAARWDDAGISEGTTTITSGVTLGYDVFLGKPGPGVSERTAEFSTAAKESGTFLFEWSYRANHTLFDREFTMQAFADGPNGRAVVNLVDLEDPGAFSDLPRTVERQGRATLTLTEGFAWGVIIGGSNFDSDSRINGQVAITGLRRSGGANPNIPVSLEAADWTTGGIEGGTTSIVDNVNLSYNVDLGNPGPGITDRTAVFDVYVPEGGTLNGRFLYTFYHAFFDTESRLIARVRKPDGTTTSTTLYEGDRQNRTYINGTFGLNVPSGSRVIFEAGGGNFDRISIIDGTVLLSDVVFEPFNPADYNEDGRLDIFDIVAFFNDFS